MEKRRRWSYFTAAALGMALLLGMAGVQDAAAGSLPEAQKEKENLEQELEEAQKLIDGLKDSKEDIQETVRKLDQKLEQIAGRINELEEQLAGKQAQINDTQAELAAAQVDRQNQYENMKLRIQFMYENSITSFLDKLLTSGSIAEFLNQAEYIAQISQYDRNMLVKYEETVESIANMETQLETDLAQLEEMKQQVQEEQRTVTALLEAKETALAQTEGEISDAEKVAQAYEAEIDAQNEIIAQIQEAEKERLRKEKEEAARKAAEEAARQEAAKQEAQNNQNNQNNQNTPNNQGGTSGGGSEEEGSGGGTETASFTWPCPSSRRVTSDYGQRESPTAGASSFHKGIDIGASHGADIVAAADGTVIFAGYSNSAGNYLTISHGGGLYTTYMHCSSLVASKGQSVSRGQVIAKVGSTGISTGNHLHFGVSVGGSYVNPWSYLK